MRLGLGCPKGECGRTKKHPIQHSWKLHGGFRIYLLLQTGFFALMLQMKTQGLYCLLVAFHPGIFYWCMCVCDECAPSFLVARLLGCSGFGDSLGHVENAASDNIQEVISMGGSLMWNYATVCGGIFDLTFICERIIWDVEFPREQCRYGVISSLDVLRV